MLNHHQVPVLTGINHPQILMNFYKTIECQIAKQAVVLVEMNLHQNN
jgi:hypothetical protein